MKNTIIFGLILVLFSCSTQKSVHEENTPSISNKWLVESIDGKPVSENQNPLQMEINKEEMKVSGNDGCNSFMGTVARLTNNEIEIGPLAGTRMMCSDMAISDGFHVAMGSAKTYNITDMKLTLFDDGGKELIVLGKVD